MSVLDAVVEFVKVVASELAGPSSAVLYNVTGSPGFRFAADGSGLGTDDTDDAGEQGISQVAYQSLGVLARPLAPSGEEHCEAAAFRTGDGLEPFAYRDLRINAAVNAGGGQAPQPGQTMFAGYGGGFLSHQQTDANTGSQKGTLTTLYVPADFDADGVPQKAHAIVIDPTPGNSSIQLVHADGVFFTLTEDVGTGNPGISFAVGDETFGRISPDEVLLQAPKIMLKGNVYLGQVPDNPAILPLAAGSLSLPCPSLYLSLS